MKSYWVKSEPDPNSQMTGIYHVIAIDDGIEIERLATYYGIFGREKAYNHVRKIMATVEKKQPEN